MTEFSKKTCYLVSGWQDIVSSFLNWRIFCIIGIGDIRKRYIRSKLGQFWLTISLSFNIAVLGFVWSYLFKISIEEYIPFLAISTIFWTYISSCVIEGSSTYINSISYLQAINIPKLSYINVLFVRNSIILLHNLLVLIPIFLLFSISLSIKSIILSFLGLILTSLFLMPVVMVISIFSLRFRDFPNIITSLMQIVFYVTPVMWKINLMPINILAYLVLNPFAVFLSLCRDPLLSTPVTSQYYIAALCYILIMWIIAFPFFSKFKNRITYWV